MFIDREKADAERRSRKAFGGLIKEGRTRGLQFQPPPAIFMAFVAFVVLDIGHGQKLMLRVPSIMS